MNQRHDAASSSGQLPNSKIRRNWKTWLFWIVPVGAALLAGWFIYLEIFRTGPELEIVFDDAAGLQPGQSQIKYRGVKIGSIEKVELTQDHRHVRVKVSLDQLGESVAREGSQFWIVKPRVGIDEIRGLRTIVAGDYITVQPGKGKRKTSFSGLSQPPAPKAEEEGLRIVLLSAKAGSVKEGSPVLFRGIKVGEVRSYDLAPDSQLVRIHVDIKKEYAPLVRMNSRFWNAGGVNFALGFSGLDVSAESAQTLVTGGIALATPDVPDGQAPQDTAFRLYDKPQKGWEGWSPSIRLPISLPSPGARNGEG